MPKTLYIIDGHSQIYRAYYARMGELSSPTGEPTRATHVFCQMLLTLLRERRPDYLVTVLDADESKLLRKQIYPEYKANRDAPPEDMHPQEQRIISILETAGVPLLRQVGHEADDIIATLVKRLADEDLHIYVVSRDKDLEQLLSNRVTMFDPLKGEEITPDSMLEKKGWGPNQAVDAQILTGDSVDNVPGVPGIGPKTAATLLKKYGSIAGVMEHVDELTPKQSDNVRAFAERVELVRELVTLRDDVPVEFVLGNAACSGFTWAAVDPILAELGFRRLREQLAEEFGGAVAIDAPTSANTPHRLDTGATDSPEGGDYRLVNTSEQLEQLARDLAKQTEFAVDTETTGVDPIDAELVGLSFAWRTGHGFYVPVQSVYGDVLPMRQVREKLGPVLADVNIRKIGQNLKYDLLVLHNAEMPVAGPLFDTMIAAFVLDPLAGSYAMDRMVERLLGHSMIPITELIGKHGKQQLRMDQVPLENVAEYASEDADYTWRLKELFEPQLAEAGVADLFHQTEMPLVAVLTEMEHNGISIDETLLAEMSTELARRADQLADQVHQITGTPFNLDSPKQLSEVLYEKLGYRPGRKTKTGRSTDADHLETLRRETGDELFELLLEYRETQKLRGTYVDALPKAISRRTGRVHTSYHQTGAVTGRLSSSEPNLQNIPVRTEAGRQIRRAFVPRSADETLIVADYSQIELRVLAHFSEDDALCKAFADDEDIHAVVAAQVNDVPLADVTKDMRSHAKAVNFGIIYGQTAFGLAQSTGMSRSEAQEFIDAYFARYPRIREFIEGCIAAARKHGHVQTILGRQRPIQGIDSRNANLRAQAERFAVNTVVQGSAADLIKIAMVRLHGRIMAESLPLRMLLQVHDELVCEAPLKQAGAQADVLRDVMGGALRLRVPLKVDVATGANWLEAK